MQLNTINNKCACKADEPNEWQVEKLPIASSCSYKENTNNNIEIRVNKDIYDIIRVMLRKYNDIEWQMMLTGEIIEKDNKKRVFITGYYIPLQEVSMAFVKNLDMIDVKMIKEKRIIAGIHSHVNMLTTPSSVDINDSIMSTIDYHIIVNNRFEYTTLTKTKLPCGMYSVVDITKQTYFEGLNVNEELPIIGIERIIRKDYNNGLYRENIPLVNLPTEHNKDHRIHGGHPAFNKGCELCGEYPALHNIVDHGESLCICSKCKEHFYGECDDNEQRYQDLLDDEKYNSPSDFYKHCGHPAFDNRHGKIIY